MGSNGHLRVAELFAGVGGFRVGLECPDYEFVWSNQWEPATKVQHASDIYIKRFGAENHSNKDISQVDVKKDVPDHDLLVGGFPCQDYSVAKTLRDALGIVGKKGVLWWQIYRVLEEKGKKRPKFLMLENVDRLLKSPAKQRGRDFAVMLASLAKLGYAVEWRVINAADYGFPQRRRRIFIMGYHKKSSIYKLIKNRGDLSKWIFHDGVIARVFPVRPSDEFIHPRFKIKTDVSEVSESFNIDNPHKSPFENAGVMFNSTVFSVRVHPDFKGRAAKLKDILLPDKDIPEEYYLNQNDIPKWEYLKGAKNILRKSKKTGRTFKYDEGPMVFPDDPEKPSRTIVTGEGGSTPSRFKHVVMASNGRLRRLVPEELEKLNMFPIGHTKEAPPVRRAFFMGNALVVGVVKKLGESLIELARK